MVYLQTTYELFFWEAYFEYFESCDFSREYTFIDVSVFIFDLRMINMSSKCDTEKYQTFRHQISDFSPPNFIFWLGRLIFSVSINLHSDNIYTQSPWSNTECKTPDHFPTNLTVTSGVIFSTRPGIYNCISFSLMSIIMWSFLMTMCSLSICQYYRHPYCHTGHLQ
jgi:hypothetical protein